MSHRQVSKGELADCTGAGPAAAAGIQAGDVIVKVGDTDVHNSEEMVAAVRELTGPTAFVIERDGDRSPPSSTSQQTQRFTSEGRRKRRRPSARSASPRPSSGPSSTQYNPLTAVPGTFAFTGDLAVELGKSLAKIPTKVGALVHSIGGGERDPETPISVGRRPSSAATPSSAGLGWRSGSSSPS